MRGLFIRLAASGIVVLSACGGRVETTGAGSTGAPFTAEPGSTSTNVCFAADAPEVAVVNKTFLVDSVSLGAAQGWNMEERVVSVSPGLPALANLAWSGLVHFQVTADTVVMATVVTAGTQPLSVFERWPSSNVDVSAGCSVSSSAQWQAAGAVAWSFAQTSLTDLGPWDDSGTRSRVDQAAFAS